MYRRKCLQLAQVIAFDCVRTGPQERTSAGAFQLCVEIIHGRGDRLIPFSEAFRMERVLREKGAVGTTVTGLFAHSQGAARVPLLGRVRQGVRLGRALRRILGGV